MDSEAKNKKDNQSSDDRSNQDKITQANNSTGPKREIGYRELLSFFLPLGITPFFISTTHSLMNAAMARLPYPELSIAVFSVVKGISNAIKAPDLMFMQLNTSLVEDKESFKLVSKFTWSICAFFFIILFILGYTPAGGWFLRTVIGLKDPEAVKLAYAAMKITCFLPLVETLRNVHRGLVISHERTKIVTAGTAMRLIAISLFILWAINSQILSGVVVAGLVWTVGIGIEGLVVFLGVYYYLGSPTQAAVDMPDKNAQKLTFYAVTVFFIPLAAMMFFRAVLRPLIQSGIARSPINPTRALAAFGVAYAFMRIIVGPIRNLHQCSLVYVGKEDKDCWKKVKKFCSFTGLFLTGVMLIISLTPLSYWILHYVIGVSAPVAELGQMVLLAFSFLPLVRSFREAYWGLLMQQQTTKLIGYTKGINVVTVFVILFVGIGPLGLSTLINPAVLGAIAYTIGQGVETAITWYYSKHNIKPAVLEDSIF